MGDGGAGGHGSAYSLRGRRGVSSGVMAKLIPALVIAALLAGAAHAAGLAEPLELRLTNKNNHKQEKKEKPNNMEASDGVLGLDALAKYVVVLNHDTMRLHLLAPSDTGGQPYHDWTWSALDARPLREGSINFWTMRTSIKGTTITSILDMGAGMTMINWAAAEKLGYKRTSFPADGLPARLRAALGTVEPVGVVRDITIWVGGRLNHNQTIIVANAAVFKYFDLESKPATNTDPKKQRDRTHAIDFAAQRIYIA